MTDGPAKGHIKLARKAFAQVDGDPFWLEHRVFSRWEAWVFVIQLASFAPYRHQTAHGFVDLTRGEFVASFRWLAGQLKWSVKSVRTWVATCQKGARLQVQRETASGTVYLIVNYDAYQSQGHSTGTAIGIVEGTAGAQQGHKREAVKALLPAATPRRTSDVIATTTLDRFPEATCNAGYDRWAAKIGALNYGSFRKALQPAYDAQPRVYGPDQLASAVDAFSDAMQADDPKWRDKWTERKFARELHHWAKMGVMEMVDEWGSPTERGRSSGLYGD